MEGFHFRLNWHFHLHRKEALVRADGLTDFNPTAYILDGSHPRGEAKLSE
jgi:hypothetical protein